MKIVKGVIDTFVLFCGTFFCQTMRALLLGWHLFRDSMVNSHTVIRDVPIIRTDFRADELVRIISGVKSVHFKIELF